jgi:site-specific recombinase XerD
MQKLPCHILPEEVERLLDACLRSSSMTSSRDYAILLLLARLGLRAGEVVALRLEDLRWHEGEIIVRGKGGVHDRMPMPVDVGEAIASYLASNRRSGRSRHVFVCSRAPHRGFTNSASVSTLVARAFMRTDLLPATRGAHVLRHSLATAMVRQGASFAEVGQLLRHRSSESTEIYVKLDFGALREIAMPWPVAAGAR